MKNLETRTDVPVPDSVKIELFKVFFAGTTNLEYRESGR
jgi:hypothetical protein